MAFRINCQQCGREAFTPGFSWKVSDHVWHLAGYEHNDVVCLECFANRLREKFGVKLAEIWRRIRCPRRNRLLVIRFSNFSE